MTRDPMTSPAGVALVTGASSGLGAAIAQTLMRRGWHVLAASRSARSDRGDGQVGARVEPLHMDVTQPASIDAALGQLRERGLTIELLVNNAGINVSGVVEEVPRDQARAVMDTNFHGVVDVTRAVLPQMRERRRGTILTIGSLAGLIALPGEAYYAAAKHALEGFLESLQYEVEPFGVRIRLAEPGFIRTNLAAASPPAAGTLSDYDAMRAAVNRYWAAAISNGMDSDEVAERIVAWALTGKGFRKRFGFDALWVPLAKRFSPQGLFFAISRRRFGL